MDHDYDIRYRSSAEHSNADALSRLPAGPYVAFDRAKEVGAITAEVQQITTEVINEFPITSKLVQECTKKDKVLSQVVNFVRSGWPTSGPECKMDALKPYINAPMEICEVNGVLDLTRFNKIAIQGAPQMAVDKEAISLSRVYSYYSKCNLPLFYVYYETVA